MKYIADTSFLIALFVNDSRSQKAREMFARLKSKREKIFIPLTAITEVVYVLEKFYKLDRKVVADYVYGILNTFNFIAEKYEMLYTVLENYQMFPSINFGDLMIAAEAKGKNIKKILTFDMDFKKLGLETV